MNTKCFFDFFPLTEKKERKLLSFEKFHGIDQGKREKPRNENKPLKILFCVTRFAFPEKKRVKRIKIRRRKENIALTSNINPIYFISNWLNSKLATVFHKKGVSCDVAVIKYWGSSIPVLKDEDTMNKKNKLDFYLLWNALKIL